MKFLSGTALTQELQKLIAEGCADLAVAFWRWCLQTPHHSYRLEG